MRRPADGTEDLDLDPSDFAFGDGPDAPAILPQRKPEFTYTDEQDRILGCNDHLIVVNAFAGCAKTTTAEGYAKRRPKERFLYLCLNKANQLEAEKRFGPGSNVTPLTTHSLAWRAMKPNRARITRSWKPALLMDLLRLNEARSAMVTMRVLADFFNSADTEISEKHVKQVAYEHDLTPSEQLNGVAFATLAWKRMLDPSDSMLMPDDAYLKMFSLKAPVLDFDTIIFDEAQDANPVTLQIIRNQKKPRVLAIGDAHQSIYQFRGSVNALEQMAVGATRLPLSKTWRFGPKVAEVANHLLKELKGEKIPIQAGGTDGDWDPRRVTTLTRTNAELFRLAAPIRGEGVHWVGGQLVNGEWKDGIENYKVGIVTDAYHLFARDRGRIRDPFMQRKFGNWDEYKNYAEAASDGEAKVVVQVVEELKHEVPQLAEDMRKNAVRESSDAAMTITTAHKSKGLEWDCVRLTEDFEVLEKAEDILSNKLGADIPVQDINLLYVAVTRAKKAVELNGETKKWLEELPKHRANREAAQSRLRAKINAAVGGSMHDFATADRQRS